MAVSRTREVFEAGAISRRDLIAEFAIEAVRTGAGDAHVAAGGVAAVRSSRERGSSGGRHADVPAGDGAGPVRSRRSGSRWTCGRSRCSSPRARPQRRSSGRRSISSWCGESGRWLVDSWDTTLGPSPVPAPEGSYATSDEVASVLSWRGSGDGRLMLPIPEPDLDLRRLRRRRRGVGVGQGGAGDLHLVRPGSAVADRVRVGPVGHGDHATPHRRLVRQRPGGDAGADRVVRDGGDDADDGDPSRRCRAGPS